MPFAYVEAAANILTNPKLDPFGKIPEYKFCAVRVRAAAVTDLEGSTYGTASDVSGSDPAGAPDATAATEDSRD
jgi:hypothetical protein